MATTKRTLITEENSPMLFVPFSQRFTATRTLHVVSTRSAEALLAAMERIVRAISPGTLLYGTTTMEDHVFGGQALLPIRAGAALVGLFGTLGLLIASVGSYGALARMVSERRAEIGIRMALGAKRIDVSRFVARDALLIAGTGLSLGVVAGAGVAHLMRAMLVGVGPLDPIAFGVAIAVFVVATALATVAPALRAIGTDPITTLEAVD